MFETHKSQEFIIPKGLNPGDLMLWKTMHLSLIDAWFFVIYTCTYKSGEKASKIIFMSDYRQITMLDEESGISINSVMLASPGYINQSDSWQFEELSEIWEGVEFECEQTGVVYVIKDGSRFTDSLEKDEKTLLNLKRVYTAY